MLAGLMCEAMILVDVRGHVLQSNEKVLAFTGLSAEQLIYDYGTLYTATTTQGTPIPVELMPLARALAGEKTSNIELILHAPESEVSVIASATPILDDQAHITGALLVFEDISRRARAERRNDLLAELTGLLSESAPSNTVFSRIAQRVAEVMGAWSVLALVRPAQDAIEFVGFFHPDAEHYQTLLRASTELSVLQSSDPGMGFVARTGRSILRRDLEDMSSLPGLDPRIFELFERFGSRSLLIVPMTARTQILGVFMLVSLPNRRRFTDEDREFAVQLVDRIASKLDNARLLADLRANERRLSLLARISRLFSNSLDLTQVLRTIVQRICDALGDWACVGLLDEQRERLRIVASCHRSSSHQARLEQLVPGEGQLPLPLQTQVIATRTPVLLTDLLDEEQIRESSINKQFIQALLDRFEPLQPISYLCVPLLVQGRPIGFLEVVCSELSGRRFQETELDLVRELGSRASVALQNAQLYAELETLIRAKDDWLSVASHELKTPLTPLQLNLELMVRRLKRGDAVTPELIDRCLAQVQVLVRLINDLLDVSSLERGQLELKPERMNFRAVIEQVLTPLVAIPKSAGISETPLHTFYLEGGLDPKGLWVNADPHRLAQVIGSVVQNAVKYSPEGGPIRLTVWTEVRHEVPSVVLKVEDQGVGIPAHELPRLFKRYFRASNVSERNFGGLGLSLWMAHEVLERSMGSIWAESEEGRGSRFYISLPLAPSPRVMAAS